MTTSHPDRSALIQCHHGRVLVGGWWDGQPVTHDDPGSGPCDDAHAVARKRAQNHA